MNKRGLGIIAIVIIAVAIIAIGGYFLYKPSTVPSTQTSTDSAASANTLAQEGTIEAGISNFAFVPSEIKIKVGSTVKWTNNDGTTHTVTSDSGGKGELNSNQLADGESYEHVFDTKGIFNYHCSIHTGMKGKVVVE